MGAPVGHPGGEREPVEAVVQVGSRITTYLRAGRGRTVLLISEGEGHPLPRDPLLQTLARSFRVIAVARPAEEGVSWLREVLEGLGLQRPHLVVRGGGGWLEPARRELGGEVGRVVRVDREGLSHGEVVRLLARDH